MPHSHLRSALHSFGQVLQLLLLLNDEEQEILMFLVPILKIVIINKAEEFPHNAQWELL